MASSRMTALADFRQRAGRRYSGRPASLTLRRRQADVIPRDPKCEYSAGAQSSGTLWRRVSRR